MGFNEFYYEHRKHLWMILIPLLILLSLRIVHGCSELWVANNTPCNGFNYTIQYFDYYNCGTYNNTPLNNGTVVNCSLSDPSVCDDNICINPIFVNTTCCVVTPVVHCPSYTYQLFNNNGTLLSNGTMLPFVNDTYYFLFNRDIGTYYVKICDDSTRQLIVEGDNMIGLTSQTWFIVTLILIFVLFMWLSFKFDPLFLLIDGIIFVYFAFYSYNLYQSWFVTVLLGMIGLLFIIVGVFAKIGQTTK